jgi:hypothetical protein
MTLIASGAAAKEPTLLGSLPGSLIPNAGTAAGGFVGPAGTAQYGDWGSQGVMALDAKPQGEEVPFHISNAPSEGVAAQGQAAATIDLKTGHNSHFMKTYLTEINGKTVYVSGVFDKDQNAFMSVWVKGDASPQLLNIKGLLDAEGEVNIGGKEYAVEVQANPLKPLRSRINIYDPNGDEESGIRLGALLSKIEAAGTAVTLGGTAYRIFYTDGVKAGPELDPANRLFSIITKDSEGDMHVFLVPESLVPSDKIAIFKLLGGVKAGLRKKDGKLEIYDNP